jgi:putative membrane protein
MAGGEDTPGAAGAAAAAAALSSAVREDAVDATRRTHLASERTYLAWWRTGLTSLTVGIGAGKIVPALTSGATWPYTIAGAGYAVLGVVCIVYAAVRRREVDEALARGDFVRPDDRVIALMTILGALLGLLVLVIVVAQG